MNQHMNAHQKPKNKEDQKTSKLPREVIEEISRGGDRNWTVLEFFRALTLDDPTLVSDLFDDPEHFWFVGLELDFKIESGGSRKELLSEEAATSLRRVEVGMRL